MPATTNIALTDGESTPVVHTFSPGPINGETANFANRVAGIPVGYELLSVRVSEPTNGRDYGKVTFRMVLPTLETTAGNTGAGIQAAPMKAYDDFVEVTFRTHKRSTAQKRKNARVMLLDLLAEAFAIDVIENLAPVY